jgi:hypothetical protein
VSVVLRAELWRSLLSAGTKTVKVNIVTVQETGKIFMMHMHFLICYFMLWGDCFVKLIVLSVETQHPLLLLIMLCYSKLYYCRMVVLLTVITF